MTHSFNDHFSLRSDQYNFYRPHYPNELFEYLASVSPATGVAWDCATGTGQAAAKLAKYFEHVIATDASVAQIEAAEPSTRVSYKISPAEHSGLSNESVHLITVAQAVHWFDLDQFDMEVTRILKPEGVLCVWSYGLTCVDVEVDRIVAYLYEEILGPYWPPERRIVENAYRDIHFSLTEMELPDFSMQCQWDLHHFVGYLSTWSALKYYQAAKQINPIEFIASDLRAAWGESEVVRLVSWPLTVKAWRKNSTIKI